MTMTKPTLLFAWVYNAGRSQMAKGWLRHLAGDRVDLRSAGSERQRIRRGSRRRRVQPGYLPAA
jgi:protein-tyrosine-phosphatase